MLTVFCTTSPQDLWPTATRRDPGPGRGHLFAARGRPRRPQPPRQRRRHRKLPLRRSARRSVDNSKLNLVTSRECFEKLSIEFGSIS